MSQLGTSDALKANYDDYYRDEDTEWRRLGALDKAGNIVRLCEDLPHRTILEIGAGEGAILKRLSELKFGVELYATEISSSGVEAIRKRAIPNLKECTLFDGYTVPYEDGQFDLAVLSHVLEHVEYPRKLLYEAARVARYIYIEVPLEDMSRLPRDLVLDKVGHINQYSPRTIRWLVQSCSLRVLNELVTNPSKATYRYQVGPRGTVNYYIKEFLLSLMPGFASKHFTFHGSIVCERNRQ
jgi:ubiquinone/menaquinone biosynthesis C-methylase UbiE